MVIWTKHALAQLRLIHNYIAQDSPIYAKRVSENLVRKTVILNEFPRIGNTVPELKQEHIRELSLYSYRILYEIKQNDIDILAVIHKRRDLQETDIPQKSEK